MTQCEHGYCDLVLGVLCVVLQGSISSISSAGATEVKTLSNWALPSGSCLRLWIFCKYANQIWSCTKAGRADGFPGVLLYCTFLRMRARTSALLHGSEQSTDCKALQGQSHHHSWWSCFIF